RGEGCWTFEVGLASAVSAPTVLARDVLRERARAVVLGARLSVGENISYYILTAFSLTFLVDVGGESRALALNALLIGAAVQFFAIPFFGHLSDRIGRRRVYACGAFGLVGWRFAMSRLLDRGSNDALRLALADA